MRMDDFGYYESMAQAIAEGVDPTEFGGRTNKWEGITFYGLDVVIQVPRPVLLIQHGDVVGRFYGRNAARQAEIE